MEYKISKTHGSTSIEMKIGDYREIEVDLIHRIQARLITWRKISDVICDRKVFLKLKEKFIASL